MPRPRPHADGADDIPFYSFSREFDLRYVLADAVVLVAYLSWIWGRGWRWPILRGLILGGICYYVDAVVWYNTPVVLEDGERAFQRTWKFTCANGVALERPSGTRDEWWAPCDILGSYTNPADAYALLKGVCDFMMTWSYALVWFTWQSIVMYIWIEGRDNDIRCGRGQRMGQKRTSVTGNRWDHSIACYSLVAFTAHFSVYPISLMLPVGGNVRAEATRHMHDSEAGWMAYMAIANVLFWAYSIFGRGKSRASTVRDTLFYWSAGCFQALGVVAPLYAFGIRPAFEASRLAYEVAFLINRGTAEHFLGCCIAVLAGRRLFAKDKAKAV